MQAITPFFWFGGNAEEAARYYVSVFPNSSIKGLTQYGPGTPMPKGTVMTVSFELNGMHFVALNGDPAIPFSGATSFVVNCETQAEVDHYWSKLGAGGQPQRCGWLIDRFGLTWQVVPKQLPALLQQPDPEKAARVMQAMMKMDKIDIATLEEAAAATVA